MSKFSELWKGQNIEKAVGSDTLDSYIKRLNISAGVPSKVVDASRAEKDAGVGLAGPVPESLLARQDLEGKCKTITVKKDGSDHELTIEIHNGSEETAKAVFQNTDLSAIAELENYMGHQIFITPEMTDSDGHKVGCYVVLGQDAHLQVFFSLKDARDFVDSVLVVNKGEVDATGKKLVELSQTAKDGDIDTTDFVRSITSVQQKRQKATIAAREKALGDTKKSFKEGWSDMQKMDGIMTYYCVKVFGANGIIVFDRYGLSFEDMKEVLKNIKDGYKGHTVECSSDLGFREVYVIE